MAGGELYSSGHNGEYYFYTASVFMSDGQYNATGNYFTSDVVNENLTAPSNGTALDASGVSG